MEQHRTIRYRLLPGTKAKARLLAGTAGACRFVWNHFVARLEADYKRDRLFEETYGIKPKPQSITFYSLCREFTLLRRHTPWLHEYSMSNVRQTLHALAVCYRMFFKGERGRPRFHSRYRQEPSFPLATGSFRLNGKWLHIGRIGQVRVRGSNPYPLAEPVSGRVKQECGKWYAYIVHKVDEADLPKPCSDEFRPVGIDRNVGQVALSTGDIIRLPVARKLEARRRRYQRQMDRQKMAALKSVGWDGRSNTRRAAEAQLTRANKAAGKKARYSKRYERTKAKLARTSRRLKHIRQDWSHQTSRGIADKHNVVYLEGLQTKSMTATAKGTAEAPGSQVKQKAGLNRSILGSSWGTLERHLSYKALVEKVPAAYTSQTCHKCGHTHKDNRKTQAAFKCLACGYRGNADVNAALNILASGSGAAGQGGGVGASRPRWPENCQIDTSKQGVASDQVA